MTYSTRAVTLPPPAREQQKKSLGITRVSVPGAGDGDGGLAWLPLRKPGQPDDMGHTTAAVRAGH